MTPEQQRIAIAEACGWTQIENGNTMAIGGSWRGYPPRGAVIGKKELLPDYLNDLNAMHEVEALLFSGKICTRWDGYGKILASNSSDQIFALVHATAPQRAEAFLRTIGKKP